MSQLTLMTMSISTSLIFTQMKHPLAMGIILLLQTLILSLLMGLMTQSFWFSYILFLVFLGGLLVLFIYMTSLASNEMFTLSPKLTILILLPLTLLALCTWTLDLTTKTLNIKSSDMISLTNLLEQKEEALLTLSKLYNLPTSMITLMLILYLFLTLIAAVKITNIYSGPLRRQKH